MSRSRLLAAVAGAVLLLPAAPAWAASGSGCQPGVGIRLADAPRGTTDPRALAYVTDHVRPGMTYQRRIEVCNGTALPLTLRFYSNAAVVENGAFRILEGHVPNELSSWITVTPAAATLAPQHRLQLTATIAVPRDATSGERYAVVLAELPPVHRTGSGVAVASRVGVRVYLDVGPGGAPRSDFVVDSLQAARDRLGRPLVTAMVHNTGARALDMRGELSLRNGPGGLSGGPFPAQLGTTLAPGQTEPVTIPLNTAITGGPWTALLTLRSGLLERRAQAVLTFPAAAGAVAPAVRAKDVPLARDRKVLIPIAAGLIALLVLLLAVVGLLTSRRRAATT